MDWRLFKDSSKAIPKIVLLNKGNMYAPVPIEHSTKMKEEYSANDHRLNISPYDVSLLQDNLQNFFGS